MPPRIPVARPHDEKAGRLPPHATLDRYYADEEEHRHFLDSIFETTARHYDRLDFLVSLGSGGFYRRNALRRAGLREGMSTLDVAAGTGLVAQAARALVGASGGVTGLDRSMGMLAESRRALDIPLVQGAAERLPFRGGSFDFLSMGYALRHVTDLEVTFREYFRVLKPGGTVLILEFARPRSCPGYALGRLYLKRLVPWLARIRFGSREAELLMTYCWETVENCVPGELILDALGRNGFKDARRVASFGIFVEYVARKPEPGVGPAPEGADRDQHRPAEDEHDPPAPGVRIPGVAVEASEVGTGWRTWLAR